jgi:hypothetical protein
MPIYEYNFMAVSSAGFHYTWTYVHGEADWSILQLFITSETNIPFTPPRKLLCLGYRDQLINVVQRKNRGLLWESYEAINVSLEKNAEVLIVKAGGTYSYHYALKQWFSTGPLPPFFHKLIPSARCPEKLSLQEAVKTHRDMRGRGSHIFKTVCS